MRYLEFMVFVIKQFQSIKSGSEKELKINYQYRMCLLQREPQSKVHGDGSFEAPNARKSKQPLKLKGMMTILMFNLSRRRDS
jgi:hypothetical protein